MSDSELYQVKKEDEEKKIISSEDIRLPTSKNPDSSIEDIIAPPGQQGTVDRNQEANNSDHDDNKKEIFQEDCSDDPDKGSPCRGQFGTIQRRSTQILCEDDDTHRSRNDRNDDDGFTTPTSSDHKIPETITCPPAPKKSIKRKLSDSPNIHPNFHVDFEDFEENIKKLRKNDHQE